ncbi:hypothetical protein BH09PAT4_BH09PAT4_06380 [soil metagenome]
MKYESFGKKLSGPIAFSVLGCSALVGAGIGLSRVEDQFIRSVQQASVYRYHPVSHDDVQPTVSEASPLQEEEVGADITDYATALGFLGASLAAISVAGASVYRRVVRPSVTVSLPAVSNTARYDSCQLTLEEVQAFDAIVAHESKE